MKPGPDKLTIDLKKEVGKLEYKNNFFKLFK